MLEALRIGLGYGRAQLAPKSPEVSLQDFFINRFGNRLYRTFFKDYTEKVWGTPCHQISAEWGAQRIKGLSLMTATQHFFKTLFRHKKESGDPSQKGTETSLIERFLYPKFVPGQLWEHVAELIRKKGGEIHMGWKVDKLNFCEGTPLRIASIEAVRENSPSPSSWRSSAVRSRKTAGFCSGGHAK